MRKLTKNKGKLQGCAILNLCQVYWGDIKIFQLKRVKVYIGGQKISWGGGRGAGERTPHETTSFLWDISFRIYKEISAAIHLFKQYSTVKQYSKVWPDYDRGFSDTCPCSESWNCVGTESCYVIVFIEIVSRIKWFIQMHVSW